MLIGYSQAFHRLSGHTDTGAAAGSDPDPRYRGTVRSPAGGDPVQERDSGWGGQGLLHAVRHHWVAGIEDLMKRSPLEYVGLALCGITIVVFWTWMITNVIGLPWE